MQTQVCLNHSTLTATVNSKQLGAAADTQVIFSYGGNSVDMIITYNDAAISFDAGGDWAPGQTATISVNAPDANRNPTSAETLNAYDETVVIPTIVMGTGGLTLSGGNNPNLEKADNANATSGVKVGAGTGGQGYLLVSITQLTTVKDCELSTVLNHDGTSA